MSACTQAGCDGAIEDGYCGVCGMAAAPEARAKAESIKTATRSERTSRSTRSTRTGSARSGRTGGRSIGSRPLTRPPLPALDPLAALVPGVVPERKRYCSSCDAPLKRDAGFCPKCGQEYSFIPTLSPGELVAGKYEIKGTIAFGGLGWIYLALDTTLTRWVTLKGLLNSKDPRMLEVAVREREYLAAVKHPNVVGIYNFITHGDQGFIVMEYVNGKTLMTLRKERNGPLPVAEAISYIAEILPALDYLDAMGLVYCDFKPENVMVEEETVKLIDMGAVRRVDDTGGDIYGSKGYIAPEAHDHPSPLSDLYSVARALAVLVASFDFQGEYEHTLPPPEEVEVWKEHEALYRFLLKATRRKPEERFQSAAEMAEQLLGVLRTVVPDTTDLGPHESALFAPDSDRTSDLNLGGPNAQSVPKLKIDKEDAAAGVILAASAVTDPEKRYGLFQKARKDFPDSLELKLRIIDELVTLGRFQEAEVGMAEMQKTSPNDLRIAWVRGRALLAQGKTQETLAAFQALVDELPGEFAPKQALGIAYEASGDLDRATRYYEAVCRADASFTSAALRLARCLEQTGDRRGAVAAYRRISSSSNRYAHAQMAIARILMTPPAGEALASIDDLVQASEALSSLDGLIDGLEAHRIRADLLASAARSSGLAPTEGSAATILDVSFDETSLRAAAEKELRVCARQAKTEDERISFVDQANAVRPLTWV